jgi:hypothetical protein
LSVSFYSARGGDRFADRPQPCCPLARPSPGSLAIVPSLAPLLNQNSHRFAPAVAKLWSNVQLCAGTPSEPELASPTVIAWSVTLLVVGAIVGWAGATMLLDHWLNRWRGGRPDRTVAALPAGPLGSGPGARVAREPVADSRPEWVTHREAAARLRLSSAGFRSLAKREGIRVVRRGRQPGVSWTDVERFIARSKIVRSAPSVN